MNHMRKSGAATALLSAGLLVLGVVTSAAAATGAASSVGFTWRAPMTSKAEGWPNGITGVSTFSVQDGMPGFNGVPGSEKAKRGDDGWYTLTRTDGAFLKLDVECVRVDGSGWAEFAGRRQRPGSRRSLRRG